MLKVISLVSFVLLLSLFVGPIYAQAPPLNVDATNNRDDKIILTWDANDATFITNYDIFSSNDYTGPFTLLDTIGNITTFRHIGLIDNFEQYYKISAWFNPNGTNSTIVFGTSGNPFVNDTSIIQEQFLWVGSDGAFISNSPRQAGVGATCADITGPSSATDAASNFEVFHPDTSDAAGCIIGKTYTLDRETSTQFLIPQFFEDTLISTDFLNDIQDASDTNFSFRCRYVSVSGNPVGNIDPRLNITAAYQVLDEDVENLSGGYIRCLTSNTQRPEIKTSGPTDYLESMNLNSSFYSFGKNIEIDDRDGGTTDHSLNAETNYRFGFNNPTFSKIWNIQEHPKFDDNSLTEAKARINSLGKFNLNTDIDLVDRGQIVMFKEFNKTQVGINDLRLVGNLLADTSTSDLHLRLEVKDGGYAMGSTVFFPQNEFDTYNTGGSLGVVHLNPQSLSIESFDISIIPNWSNSTQDIFTVFIGVDDNSTTGSLSVNITSFEIDSIVKQDFEDLGYVQYYESTCSTECDSGEVDILPPLFVVADGLEARNFYNEGLVHAEQIATTGVTGLTLPLPSTPTFANVTGIGDTTLDLIWNQDLLNTTDFQISRESPTGNGFQKLTDTNNVTLAYFDIGLLQGTQYNYEICAINGEVIETTCITASAFTAGTPFDPPQNLVATTNLLTQINLTWDAENATGVTGYTIYNSSTGSSPFDILGDNSDNSTTFSDLGLPNNFDMFYKVSAFGIVSINGTNSTVALGSTIQPGQPVNIDNVNATAILPFDVLLEWADSGINITDYKIDRNGTEIISSLLIEHGNITTKAFIDNSTSLGTHFLYNVSGINAPNGSLSIVGNSTTSNLVKTNDVPSQVLNVIADLANFFTLNQIELSWTQANNGSGNPLGIGVNLTETRVYSKNITDGDGFILTTTLLATSPPPTEYNDTNIIIPNDYSYVLSSCNVLGCGPNSTEVFADSVDFPDAIFDLLFYDLTFQSLVLNWTQPFLGGGSLQDGYQINFTTPHAEPLTIIIADTESSFTEFTVSGLTELTNYTFRVSAINQAGLNTTGLKLNITTLDDFVEENFTVGDIGEFPDTELNATNINIIAIVFERIDVNDTTVRLNVTYASNIDLACEFDYKFAQTDSFFDAPLDTVNIGGGQVETSFLFLDFDNEVVDVFCWNEINNQSASFILTQTNFPLLQQVQAFRDGDFGTEGMFGVIDMITLMVIIISMIGFNRVNETVGALFNIIFIGALSFFGIIELSTTIFSAIAVVLMLVIITTRKV